jgi:hypothetical protein
MEAIYRMRAEELNGGFIQALKDVYSNKNIEIRVHEIEDETEYLLKDEANRKHLLEAVAADKAGKSYRTMDIEELESMLI